MADRLSQTAYPDSQRPMTLDVSALPTVAFGIRSMTWWGVMGMMTIEASVFALAIVAYFYLHSRSIEWPPQRVPPDLFWGTLNTAIFLLSVIPTEWYRRRARRGDAKAVRIGLVAVTFIGALNLLVRYFELRHLNTDWSINAYGSIVWLIMGLHVTHLLTDWVDTIVLTVLFFTGLVEGKRFEDAEENAAYWYFVVITWIPIYLVIYWAPRWLAG
jgi:heme/copper-type cytochrome/quinol oxidase subunit 3